jgi:hypothetical protein
MHRSMSIKPQRRLELLDIFDGIFQWIGPTIRIFVLIIRRLDVCGLLFLSGYPAGDEFEAEKSSDCYSVFETIPKLDQSS